MKPVVFIVGPTACGKSDVALRVAEAFGGAILNCDSLQVYKRLDIGTAKPSEEERRRAPHFLFDFVPPGEVLTAGDFRKAALDILSQEAPIRMILAVGGSGFYIQALEKGMFPVDKPAPESERAVRSRLEREGLEALYGDLRARDPDSAAAISPNDAYRIVRALVIMEDSGEKASVVKARFKPQPFPYPHLKVGISLDRDEVVSRVERRTRQMLERGLVAEVEALLAEGFESWPPLRSVGYKECVDHLRGRVAREDLAPLIVMNTMKLVKKQRTWFKRDPEIRWLKGPDLAAEAVQCVRQWVDDSGK